MHYLILPLDIGEVSLLHSSCFVSAKTVPATHRIGSLWALESVWLLCRRAKSLSQLGITSIFSSNPASSLVTVVTELLLSIYV